MFYNIEKNKIQKSIDCQSCSYLNKKNKKCMGLGKCCFEYDEKTMTCIDPVTKLPIKKIK